MADASAPSWVELTEGEKVVWSGHPSRYMLAGSVGVAVVLVAAGIAIQALLTGPLAWAGWVLVLVGALIVVAGYLRLKSVQYVITDEEVYLKRGMLSRQVKNVRLDRIQNTGFDQTVLQRLLSYGNVRVDTAGHGGTEIVLRSVPNPERVNGLLTERLGSRTDRTRETP